MTIELVVFDLDGILIKEHCWASKLFEKLYGIPWQEFYEIIKKNKLLKRTKGQGSTFNLFHDLFEKYNIKIMEEKFWNIWLTNFKVNQKVVDFALSLERQGKKIGILSDTFVERAEYIRENFKWIKEFDYVLFSCDVGVTKDDSRLFEILIEKTGLKPKEILFIDDEKKNVQTAKKFGIHTVFYTDFDGFVDELRKLGVEV